MKKLPAIMVVFLTACKSNQRIIEDSMQSIGSQSYYVAVAPEPQSLWPLAVILGIVILLVLAGIVWYVIYNKEASKKVSPPRRRVTRVYYPQPTTPHFDQSPFPPQQQFPSNPRFSQSSYPPHE